MKDRFLRFKNYLRNISNKENVIGHLIKLLYYLIKSPIMQALIGITFTVILTIQSANLGSQNDRPIITNMIVVSFFYAVFVILSILVNSHTSEKQKDMVWFQESLKKLMSINLYSSNKLHTLNKEIAKQCTRSKFMSIENMRSIISFQSVSFTVCSEICQLLDKQGVKNYYVTVFQCFKERERNYCKMVAYHNHESRIPDSFGNVYFIDKGTNQKKHFHTSVFEKDSSKIYILENSKEVQKAFVINDSSREREEQICQYIGLPYRVNCKDGVTIAFLLQIDVDKEKALGNDKYEMRELARNIFSPFMNLLAVAYEQDKLIETIHETENRFKCTEIEVKNNEKEA